MCDNRWQTPEAGKSKNNTLHTSILCTGSVACAACCNRVPYSMYSDILCRKLNGSLNITGMVILDSSCKQRSVGHIINYCNVIQLKIQDLSLQQLYKICKMSGFFSYKHMTDSQVQSKAEMISIIC